MPFCPNQDCPHKKRTGKPAEFQQGVSHCSDCGSYLLEEYAEKAETQKTPQSDFYKRIIFTVGLLAVSRMLLCIPPPGISAAALLDDNSSALFSLFGLPHFSIVCLGIMPYISAYVVIEILSLIIPPLKSWRAEGSEGRKKLFRSARLATLFFAFLQGYGIALGLENMMAPGVSMIVPNPGWNFRLLLILTLTTGTFLLVWIADLITTKGVGHGISILLFAGFSASFYSNIHSEFSELSKIYVSHVPFERFILVAFAVFIAALLIMLVAMIEKSHKKIDVIFNDVKKASLPIKLTTAGIVPATFAASLIMLPLTLGNFFSWSWLECFFAESVFYYIVYALLIIFLYFVFTSIFHYPEKIVNFLKNRNASIVAPQGKSVNKFLDNNLEIMALCGAIYLSILCISSRVVLRFWIFPFGALVLIKLVSIALDILEEARIRKEHKWLVKVGEFHDPAKAGLAKSLLEKHGIPSLLRGYYHRALLYFFGPYIEISLLVPQEKVKEASETINRYELL